MVNVIKLDLNNPLSKEKVEIRKQREIKRKKRFELIKAIDFYSFKVEHVYDGKLKTCPTLNEWLILEKINSLGEELNKLSNDKKYEIQLNELEESDMQIEEVKRDVGIGKVCSVKMIDRMITPKQLAEMRETFSLTEIADKLNIQYKALRNWSYTRGVKEHMQGKKIVRKYFRNIYGDRNK